MNKLKSPILEKGEGIYIVEEGDTLISVAKKFNLSPRTLIIDNGIDKELIKGQFLYISRRGELYTVKVDDTFEKIARKFGVFVSDIKNLNKIEYLYPGEIIVIPTKDYERF